MGWKGHRFQDRDPGQLGQDVQDDFRPCRCLRFQDRLRWRQVDRLRPDLRDHGLRQEVRAQVQADQAAGAGEEGTDLKEAAEGEEEQDEEGQGNQEGQGRSRRQEVIGLCHGLEDISILWSVRYVILLTLLQKNIKTEKNPKKKKKKKKNRKKFKKKKKKKKKKS